MIRLRYLVTVSCFLGATVLAGCQPKHKPIDEVFDSLVEQISIEEVKHSPELLGRLGEQKKSFNFATDYLLDDRSLASMSQIQVTRLEELQSLSAIDKTLLSPKQQNTYLTLENLLETSAKLSNFQFGDVSLISAHPYVISHLDGAYIQLPSFLANYHDINNLRDAQEYVERLESVATAMDDELSRFLSDKEKGIYPPNFILDQIITTAQRIHDTPLDESPYITSLQYRMEYLEDLDLKTGQSLLDQAKIIVSNDILPAYARMITAISNAKSKSTGNIGISKTPAGEQYYQAALNYQSSTQQTPEKIHQLGLKLVTEINTELNLMLDAQELSEGSVGDRLAQLSSMPEYLFEDSDEGRTALLNSLSEHIISMRALLPRSFNEIPSREIDVVRIPENIQDSTPGGYYQAAPIGKSGSATYNINLRDMNDWPQWSLATLSYHEALPGHHLQNSIQQNADLPLIQRLARYPAFVEGWALYAEDLADEMGVYADNPLERIGYLQSLLLRAARLVVDTGIHSKNWSREQAIQYLVNTTGYSHASMQTEVDRYVVWPGQACSYMLGRNEIRRLRKEADLELGNRFELKNFHTVLLAAGARPFSIVRNDITKWVNAQAAIVEE